MFRPGLEELAGEGTRPNRFRSPRRSAAAVARLEVVALEDRIVPAAGALDTTFGTGGVAGWNLGPDYQGWGGGIVLQRGAVQQDGQIVVAGLVRRTGGCGLFSPSGYPGADTLAVVRYHQDGSPDTSFGVGGQAVLPLDAPAFTLDGLSVTADGKILVGFQVVQAPPGHPENYYNSMRVAEFTAAGQPVSDFGTAGVVDLPEIGRPDGAEDTLAVQAGGQFLVLGEHDRPGQPPQWVVERFDAHGHLDQTFGQAGQVDLAAAGTTFAPVTLAITPDGKIILGGNQPTGNGPSLYDRGSDLALARLNPDGSLDPSFATGGQLTTNLPGLNAYLDSLLVQPDGHILVAGGGMPHGYYKYAVSSMDLVRYTSDGHLDPTLDGDGIRHLGLQGVNGLALQPDGQILVSGHHEGLWFGLEPARTSYDGVLRLQPDGTDDYYFGAGGEVSDFDLKYNLTSLGGIMVQPGGGILLMNYQARNLGVVRLLGA